MRTKCLSGTTQNIWICILLGLFAFWYISNIHGALTHDEVLYVQTARALVSGTDMYIWPDHPRLSHYIIAAGLLASNWSPIGARFPAFVLSICTLFLIYKTGETLANKYIGLLSTIFVGTMKLFAQHAIVALLDMSLTFFVILLCYSMLHYLSSPVESRGKKRLLISLGIMSFCTAATRYAGVLFLAVAFFFIVQKEVRVIKVQNPRTLLNPLKLYNALKILDLKYYLIGFGASFFLVYIPYMKFDTETIRSQLAGYRSYYSSNPLLVSFIEILPYLPSVFYLFARSIGANLIIATGHTPWWLYFYWIWEYGGLTYAAGLMLSVLLVANNLRKEDDTPILFMVSYAIIPLVLLSLVGSKSLRYMLPFFSLFTIIILTLLYKFMKIRLMPQQGNKIRRSISKISYIILVTLFVMPTSPVFATIQNPSIKTDSGYDIAAIEVIKYLNNTDKEEIWFLIDTPHILEYYLGYHIKNPCSSELLYLTDSPHLWNFYRNNQKDAIKCYIMPFWNNINNESVYKQLEENKFDVIITSKSNLQRIYDHLPPNAKSEIYLKGDLYMLYSRVSVYSYSAL